jgi:hypothetical protein
MWDAHYLKNTHVGYDKTTVRRTTESGREVVRSEGLSHLVVKRANDRAEQEIRCVSVETPDGRLLRFECEMQMGPTPVRTVAEVHGDRLDMETTTAGKNIPASMPWSAECKGPFGTEQSLLHKPMQPGERRSIRLLLPVFNQVADVEISAKDYETTQLLSGPHELLRINKVTNFSSTQKIEETIWTDRTGDTLKTFSPAMEMTTYRTTKAEATADADAADLDLLSSTMVNLEQPLPKGHQSQQVRYRVHLDGGDPAGVFVNGPSQQVKSIDANTAEVIVYAIRPDATGGNPTAPTDLPTNADSKPNNMIQSDDPLIVTQAKQAVGDETDPWRVATALEGYVHRAINKKDYSQVFATAAEVAKSHEGDCTEHAVYLAALARARGIPARVAIGLVYMEKQGKGAFYYHMWTEVFIDGRWIPLDGTLALSGIGAAHLKIAQTDLQGASAYSAFLPVLQVVGRLHIEALAAE